jgi:hypothetical protein
MSMDEPIRPRELFDMAPGDAFAGYLDELQWLCNAATPGPWTIDESGDGVVAQNGNPIAETWGGTRRLGDARFIAAARYALPRLIAELRRLSGGGHV